MLTRGGGAALCAGEAVLGAGSTSMGSSVCRSLGGGGQAVSEAQIIDALLLIICVTL